MTWNEWTNSSYYNQNADIGSFEPKKMVDCQDEIDTHYDKHNMTNEDWANYQNELLSCYDGTESEDVLPTSIIKDKSEGCYMWAVH